MSKKAKNIRFSGWLFLVAYLFLLGITTLHLHHYDFNNYTFLHDETSGSLPANDIIQDFSGSCIVHYFADSLINNFHPASEILNTKPLFNEFFRLHNFFTPSPVQYSSITLRAPPASV